MLSDPLGSNSVALNNTGQVIGLEHYRPYGTVDYQWGSMPTAFNYAGERLDSQSGLLYDNFRYYDPLSGRFVRADTVQDNSNGMDPYAYVGDNPETRNDPSGHCWPWCTAIIGAVLGAAISVGVTLVKAAAVDHKPPSLGEVLGAAASGAVSGAIIGVTGPGSGIAAAMGFGAISGGVGGAIGGAVQQGVTNVTTKGWSHIGDGVLEAAGWGALTGAITGAATGGLMRLAAPLVRRGATAVLQSITDAQNAVLSTNPALAANFLSRAQYAVGQRVPWLAATNYGTALENMVANQVENSPWRWFFSHQGASMPGVSVPDFVGRGPLAGLNFDITTNTSASITAHVARPYGEGLNLIFYSRPPGFRLFP